MAQNPGAKAASPRTYIDDRQNTFTSSEAAFYIGLTESYLRQQRSQGNPDQPPYLRIGRTIRYRRSDLDDWLEAHRCEVAS